jgi:hypothetical protein
MVCCVDASLVVIVVVGSLTRRLIGVALLAEGDARPLWRLPWLFLERWSSRDGIVRLDVSTIVLLLLLLLWLLLLLLLLLLSIIHSTTMFFL